MKKNRIVNVILNYNDAPTTIKLLESIRQFAILDYIVVVDNNSTDDSWGKLQPYGNDKIHLIRAERNGGYGAGNNVGVRYAKEKLNADYVLIANPDVIFDEDCVSKMLESFLSDSKVAVSSACQFDSSPCAWKNCTFWQYVLSATLFFEVWMKIRCYPKSYYGRKKEVEVFAVPGSLLMVDARKMLQYGMYDEEFFLYYEEPVLGQKFADAGLKTVLRLDTNYIHDHHVSISKTYRRWSQQHEILLKSAELFLRKYKKGTRFQMALAKAWFAYTKVEFWLYDLFCLFKVIFRRLREQLRDIRRF